MRLADTLPSWKRVNIMPPLPNFFTLMLLMSCNPMGGSMGNRLATVSHPCHALSNSSSARAWAFIWATLA